MYITLKELFGESGKYSMIGNGFFSFLFDLLQKGEEEFGYLMIFIIQVIIELK